VCCVPSFEPGYNQGACDANYSSFGIILIHT
jgi:hypothetical protein